MFRTELEKDTSHVPLLKSILYIFRKNLTNQHVSVQGDMKVRVYGACGWQQKNNHEHTCPILAASSKSFSFCEVKRKITTWHFKKANWFKVFSKTKKKEQNKYKRNPTTDLLQELQNCIKVIMSLGHLTGSVRR